MPIGPYITSSQVAKSTPFDNTSVAFNSTDVQAALQELRSNPEFDFRSQATTLNGTLTLTSSDVSMQILTGSATGYSVKMPDATTLYSTSIGATYYQIANTSSQNITMLDGSGASLFTLSQSSIGYLWLQAQGSSAGTWLWYQSNLNTAAGIINYNIVSSTNFSTSANTDTVITGMTVTPEAGTYAVWYSSENTGSGSGQELDCTIYKGGVAVADSKRSAASPSGSHLFFLGTQTITQVNGTQAVDVRVNANGNSQTVNQRSLILIRLGT